MTSFNSDSHSYQLRRRAPPGHVCASDNAIYTFEAECVTCWVRVSRRRLHHQHAKRKKKVAACVRCKERSAPAAFGWFKCLVSDGTQNVLSNRVTEPLESPRASLKFAAAPTADAMDADTRTSSDERKVKTGFAQK